MQSHIQKAFKIINKHLPNPYVKKVMHKALEQGIDVKPRVIHNVRSCHPRYNLENHTEIISLLVEVAKENKRKQEKLQKITN